MPQLKYKTAWWKTHYMTTRGGQVERKRHEKTLRIRGKRVYSRGERKRTSESPQPPKITGRPSHKDKQRGGQKVSYIATVVKYDKSEYKKGERVAGKFIEVENSEIKANSHKEAVDKAVALYGEKIIKAAKDERSDIGYELEVEEQVGIGHGKGVVERSTDLGVIDIENYSEGNWFEQELDKGDLAEKEGLYPRVHGSIPDRKYTGVSNQKNNTIITYVASAKDLENKKNSGKQLTELEQKMLTQYQDDVKFRSSTSSTGKRPKRSGKERSTFKKEHPFIYIIHTMHKGKTVATDFTHNATEDDSKNSSYGRRNFEDILNIRRGIKKRTKGSTSHRSTPQDSEDLSDQDVVRQAIAMGLIDDDDDFIIEEDQDRPLTPEHTQAMRGQITGSNVNRDLKIIDTGTGLGYDWRVGNSRKSYVEPSAFYQTPYKKLRRGSEKPRPPLPPVRTQHNYGEYSFKAEQYRAGLAAYQQHYDVNDAEVSRYMRNAGDVRVPKAWDIYKGGRGTF